MPAYCKASEMITLTAPNGSKLSVAAHRITAVFGNTGLYHSAAKSVVVIDGNKQAVQESVEDVEKLVTAE